MILQAKTELDRAERVLIAAGAGMGVDSGLPDFRGDEGFWTAYPPFRGRAFHEMANPQWFDRLPEVAWGFYGHRMNLYRETQPHEGYFRLLRLANSQADFAFVFTSNVDGQFQKSGFGTDHVLECHGSIFHWQCSRPCGDDIWEAPRIPLEIDGQTFRCRSPIPRCRNCEAVARPNVLMFGDSGWIPNRSAAQERRYAEWRSRMGGRRLVAVECGAGTAVPTVRYETERWADTVVRINPREPEGGDNVIGIAAGARETLGGLIAHADAGEL